MTHELVRREVWNRILACLHAERLAALLTYSRTQFIKRYPYHREINKR
jgi:hypothetical protein